jgi:competence transcription factor ComK
LSSHIVCKGKVYLKFFGKKEGGSLERNTKVSSKPNQSEIIKKFILLTYFFPLLSTPTSETSLSVHQAVLFFSSWADRETHSLASLHWRSHT